MTAKETWNKLKRPALSQADIDQLYFSYRAGLPLKGRHQMDRGREGRVKTMQDLIDLDLI